MQRPQLSDLNARRGAVSPRFGELKKFEASTACVLWRREPDCTEQRDRNVRLQQDVSTSDYHFFISHILAICCRDQSADFWRSAECARPDCLRLASLNRNIEFGWCDEQCLFDRRVNFLVIVGNGRMAVFRLAVPSLHF